MNGHFGYSTRTVAEPFPWRSLSRPCTSSPGRGRTKRFRFSSRFMTLTVNLLNFSDDENSITCCYSVTSKRSRLKCKKTIYINACIVNVYSSHFLVYKMFEKCSHSCVGITPGSHRTVIADRFNMQVRHLNVEGLRITIRWIRINVYEGPRDGITKI